jgi:hypothetical protein
MRTLLFLLALLACAAPLRAQDRVEVDVELFLAVDVSRSMQPFELEIQRRGYAAALASAEVQNALAGGMLGRIAVTYVEWAGLRSQRVIVPWTLIQSQSDADRVAAQIISTFDDSLRRTSISSALDHATASIADNSFDGLRRVIDISGDGPNNMGAPVTEARDRALAQGITINGLPLMTHGSDVFARWSIPDLDAYYTACVIGGSGAFVLPVTDWAEFESAVRRKLVLEIAGLPEQIYRAPDRASDGFDRAPDRASHGFYRAQARPLYNCLIGEEIWERNRAIFAEP